MGDGVPCGCAYLARADRTTDREASRGFRIEGEALQREWGCPAGGHAAVPINDEHAKSLAAVARLTGRRAIHNCTTCPLHGASPPWVRYALRVRRWRDKSALAALGVRLPLAGTLVDAIDIIDASVDARSEHELELARERSRPPPPTPRSPSDDD